MNKQAWCFCCVAITLSGCATQPRNDIVIIDPNVPKNISTTNRQYTADSLTTLNPVYVRSTTLPTTHADNEAKSQYYGSYVSPGYRSWRQVEPKRPDMLPGDRARELDYIIRTLADQLALNRDPNASKTPVAVTSLSNIDDLQNTNWLGQAISEAFIHELHIREVPVIDFKTTGKIRVTPEGDFVFSREWDQLRSKIPVYRIFTGTMSRNDEGVVVNVRTINMQTLLVESTGRAFIPNRLLIGAKNSLNAGNNDAYIQRFSVPSGVNGRTVEFVK
ncbi:FlgO family outer membrane protein [Motilimonas cestriensis]|nr:FlgO family outer membrane protein [Motilimonas cestriensis]